MSKRPKDAETVALADAMVRELGSLREQGGAAYPPGLRQLAALTGVSATDEQVQTAAAKRAFTAKVVITEKVDKKPSLDSPVYFKGDAPKPDQARDLALRFLLVLGSQKQLGAEAYPPILRRLAELCDLNPSNALVTKAADHKAMTEVAVVAANVKSKPCLDAPVVLSEDIKGDITRFLPALLRFALSATTTTTKSKGKSIETETTAFTLTEVKGRFVEKLKEPVLEALERGIERQELPEDVAWVVTKGKPYLFLVENLRPGAPRPSRPAAGGNLEPSPVAYGVPSVTARPARDFSGDFREAFEHLDRRNGATNFVKLADLRRTLAWVGRDEFDDELRALRLRGEFSLDSHEGLHGSLTPEEREAGVREAGSLLVYVSRR